MKTKIFPFILSVFVMFSCSESPVDKGTGYLTLNINPSASMKSDVLIEDFILRINNGSADVFKERIRDLPAAIVLPVGAYTVEAYSMEFSEPKFETPFYSGSTTVEIEAGQTKEATLVCAQANAGIRVVWSNDFSTLYSTYQAFIECSEGYLHYSSTENRTGYFLPGTVSITIQADGFTINGGTLTLAARDMVTTTLQPKEQTTGNISIVIAIDESVNEREVTVIVDSDEPPPNSETNPYTIAQAIERQGENAVWVEGYIVGSIYTSGDYNFTNPEIWRNTNIVLADNIEETDSHRVIFVELRTTVAYRPLILVDNNDILHRKVLLRGNLRAYQSRAGLRDLTDGFSFVD